ncbi:MAG: bifunctional aspartate kinase/homoserine dehydrogenase I [Bacteroidales bacterium]|nr:bifunctional aspartate kinase/homoserine dehydrogenase I [Bacteroidales bacterium]
MKVLKFGGVSVGSAQNIKRVKEIILSQNTDVIVVVSALYGITDKILEAAHSASAGTKSFNNDLDFVKTKHYDLIKELFQDDSSIKHIVDELLDELYKILSGIALVRELTTKTLDRIEGIGERISSHIVAQYLGLNHIDMSELISTDSNFGNAAVDFETTNLNIKKAFKDFSGVAVVPGFISKNEKGEYTTIGRGGSDYTAAIISAALNAEVLEIWTDVDGYMTADPSVIRKAYTIPELSYAEAMELSHFGAKVVYPPTILPVYQKGIPIHIKNIINPENQGTIISKDVCKNSGRTIKGVSSISGITLITLHGLGMVGVTGISMRLFTALSKENVNVILISQASSENSISVAIDEDNIDRAYEGIKQEFEKELNDGRISQINMEKDLAIVAVVGEGMKRTTGVSGKLFSTIGRNGINIIAIAQGASELNISWVVKREELRKTLNVVHESFFLSENVEINVFLMGIGTVGGNLLQQLGMQQKRLLEEKHLRIKLVGVANSRKMAFDRDGISIDDFMEVLDKSEKKSSLQGFVDNIKKMNIYNSVFVDCTASEDVAAIYKDILQSNVSIVAANKVAASSDYHSYKELKEIAKKKGVKFLFETNVGAGLPIINTLNDLIDSGDKILKIEAVLSGTLNYIFNVISAEVPLSKAIKQAEEKGFSEPDPRVDLSGIDVARKILILARESGYQLEMSDIKINRFIPDLLFEGSLDSFWESISSLDDQVEKDRLRLLSENKKLRFVAKLENGCAEVGLQEVDSKHPFYDLEGSNNVVIYNTDRYRESPMLIKGYGAGAEVTAAGVFADLIKVSKL